MRRWARSAVGLLLAVAGCADAERKPRADYPSSPEPAVSPPLAAAPVGSVASLGSPAEGMVADGVTGLVAVGLRQPPALALVDAGSGRVVRRVALPGAARHLALERPGGPVLAPSEPTDQLLRVSLPAARITAVAVGDRPHDAAALGERVFVGDERADTVSVIDGARVTRRLPAPYGPGGVAVSGGKVAVVGVIERMVALWDGRSLRSLGRTGAGVGPTHLVVDRRGWLYVVDTEGEAIVVYRVRPRLEVSHRFTVPGAPYGVAYDRARDRLWVTSTQLNQLHGFDLSSQRPRPPLVYPTVRQPNTVAVDPRSGRVFVAGASDGDLQVIDPPGTPAAPRRPAAPAGPR